MTIPTKPSYPPDFATNHNIQAASTSNGDNQYDVIDIGTALREDGYDWKDVPAYEDHNYLFKVLGQWARWAESYIDQNDDLVALAQGEIFVGRDSSGTDFDVQINSSVGIDESTLSYDTSGAFEIELQYPSTFDNSPHVISDAREAFGADAFPYRMYDVEDYSDTQYLRFTPFFFDHDDSSWHELADETTAASEPLCHINFAVFPNGA